MLFPSRPIHIFGPSRAECAQNERCLVKSRALEIEIPLSRKRDLIQVVNILRTYQVGTKFSFQVKTTKAFIYADASSKTGVKLIMSFPDKASREKCWANRDAYWECLNANESMPKEKDTCGQLRALFEAACPAQWVKHFDRRREYLKFKAKIENDGFEPIAEIK